MSTLPAALGITPLQARFAELTGMGYSLGEAALALDMSPEAARRWLAHPGVAVLVRHVASSRARTELLPLSHSAIRDILSDVHAPASARVAAARLVWQAAGIIGTNADAATRAPLDRPPTAAGDPPISATADAELAAVRDRLEALRSFLSRAVVDATPSQPVSNPLD